LSAAKATFCGASTARDAEAGVSLELKIISGNETLENQSSGYHPGAQTAARVPRSALTRARALRSDFSRNLLPKATKHFGFWYNHSVFGARHPVASLNFLAKFLLLLRAVRFLRSRCVYPNFHFMEM
jgi:hypothetical protein